MWAGLASAAERVGRSHFYASALRLSKGRDGREHPASSQLPALVLRPEVFGAILRPVADHIGGVRDVPDAP